MTTPRAHRPVSLENRGIGHVGLKVSNLQTSLKFYHAILGLPNETKGSSVAFVRCGPDVLVLYEEAAGKSDFHYGFRLDKRSQVDEWMHWLRSNNIPIHENINEDGHPRSIKFRDPDGHWVEIASEK